ncbi:receptor-like protein EIX1 [Lycium barbarum]|uniref:receptor-like protein EIX1 n=1 Tax=Lycium barbarum TaxID=112863 RepID=UPI00293E207F|nr:receptor-like protein EIX1 [Lycium barbarum]
MERCPLCDNQTGNVIRLDLRGPSNHNASISIAPLIGKLSHALQELKQLKFLDLSYNQISGGIPDFLGSLMPPNLGSLSSLNSLDLSHNSFLSVNNLEWVSRLHQLRYLAISYVNTSKATDWLESVLKLPSLQVLSLASSMLPAVFPSLFNSSNLTHLDLSGNALHGPIPDALWNMKSLQHLNLSRNALGGGFPRCLGNSSNLKFLRLASNNLDGKLPEIMKNLSCMSVL